MRTALHVLSSSPDLTAGILLVVGAPLSFDQLMMPVSAEQIKFAFLTAPLIRRRLTLSDLFILLNWDRETLWANTNTTLSGLQHSPDRNR